MRRSAAHDSVARISGLLALACLGAIGCGPTGEPDQTAADSQADDQPFISDSSSFRQIAVGASHTCALTWRGEAWCWGSNGYGQLGIGSADHQAHRSAERAAPHLVLQSIAAGRAHTCGLDTAGAAWCWGHNENGQIGAEGPDAQCRTPDGTEPCRPAPARVGGGRSFVAIAVGSTFSCGLDGAGTAWCWGGNRFQQHSVLGTRDPGTCSETVAGEGGGEEASFPCGARSPVQVAGAPRLVAIRSGWTHSCGLGADGSAYCWGSNQHGELGSGGAGRIDGAVRVAGAPALVSVEPGSRHTCGLARDGAIWCWGSNESGALGVDSTAESCASDSGGGAPLRRVPCALRPVRVQSTTYFRFLETGPLLSCALDRDGAAHCWPSRDARGNLTGRRPEPYAMGRPLVSISTGYVTCGLDRNGIAVCRGWNDGGQLGAGLTTRHSDTAVVVVRSSAPSP
ncbi:MAG TPA: hypothetical protein VNL98_01750 [Gemmatimonadales bacterium]|nr:hypothetical protein [Gemmatimonadales bacterium]